MSNDTDNAPLAIFTYNRPVHTERLLKSLKRNPEYETSPLVIYCDGSKSSEHEQSVAATREVVKALAPSRARVIMREENLGLANSIMTGVTENTQEFGKVIVAEDDLVFTPGALGYLNEALRRYENEDRVMHISAYMFPVEAEFDQPFFYREATCWGWATWERAWNHYDPDAGALMEEIDQRGVRKDYDVRGSMFFYQMLKLQRDGKLESWAIRWYTSMFLRGGLSLHPAKSYVENLGFDGSGVHCNVDDRFVVPTTSRQPASWPTQIEESEQAIEAMIAYRKSAQTWQSRAKRKVFHAANRLNPFS